MKKTLRKRQPTPSYPPWPEGDIQIIDYHPARRDNVAEMTREEKLEWADRELAKDPERINQALRSWHAERPELDFMEEMPDDEEFSEILLHHLAMELKDSSIEA